MTKLQAPTVAHWSRARERERAARGRRYQVVAGPVQLDPRSAGRMIICKPSSPRRARPPTLPARQRHLHALPGLRPLPSFLADLAPRNPPCRPLYVHVHPLITSYPAHLPAPNPLIIFTRRSDSPAPGGPIPFTFHYELAAIPTIEPAAFFSSRLCRGHLHPRRLVSVLPDRRQCLRR